VPGLESGHFERAFSGSRRIRRSLWSCGCLLFHLAKSDPRAPQRRAKLTDVFRSRDRQTRSASGTIPRPRDGDAIPPSAGCVSRRTATRSPRTRGAIRGGRITPSLHHSARPDSRTRTRTKRLVSNLNPLRGCNSQQAQYYNTPPLHRAPLIEDEDDDEHEDDFEAPGEGRRTLSHRHHGFATIASQHAIKYPQRLGIYFAPPDEVPPEHCVPRR
jgi:hypothetical protein